MSAMNPSGSKLARLHINVDDFQKGVAFNAAPHVVNRTPRSELWLPEFTDPDGNQPAFMMRRRQPAESRS